MKRLVAALLVAGVLAGATVPAVATAAGSRTIVGIAAATPQLSTLVKLVRSAGLVGALNGRTKLTVFAPTNAAFARVPARTLKMLAHNQAMLRRVLLYHVVAGAVPAAAVEKLHRVRTLEGGSLTVRVRMGAVYINQAKVIQPNVMASNGIVHVIDSVLIP